MSPKKVVRGVLFCLVAGFGSLVGVTMTPTQIEELMSSMHRPTVAHTLPEDRETGDDLIRKLLSRERDPK